MNPLKQRIVGSLVLLALGGASLTGCGAPEIATIAPQPSTGAASAAPATAHAPQPSTAATAATAPTATPVPPTATPAPTAAPEPTATPAPATATPAPATATPAPAPAVAGPTIGQLFMNDQTDPNSTANSWSAQAGHRLVLFAGKLHNAQKVTFKIVREKGAQADVLGEADVVVPGTSADGGASIFWEAEAGHPTVWISAVASDAKGRTVSTKAYPLRITAGPAPEIGSLSIAPFEHSPRYPNDPKAQQVRAGASYDLLITGIKHATMAELSVENASDSRAGYVSVGKVGVAPDGSARFSWTVPETGLADAMVKVTVSNGAGPSAERIEYVMVEPLSAR